jgi:hypothetical protein
LPTRPLHLRVDVPDDVVELRIMLVVVTEQVRPVGTVSVRLTIPLKLLIAAIVIVEFASLFVGTVELGGLVEMLKSTPATEMVAEADKVPEVPVTVITALPVVVPAVMVIVAFCFAPIVRVTVPGVNFVRNPQVQPFAVALRLTGPLKLPTLVTVIVELTDVPAGILSACGLADSTKP